MLEPVRTATAAPTPTNSESLRRHHFLRVELPYTEVIGMLEPTGDETTALAPTTNSESLRKYSVAKTISCLR